MAWACCRIFLVGVGAQTHRIFVHQIILDGQRAGVIQIGLACRSIRLQRLDDLVLAVIERLLAGFAARRGRSALHCSKAHRSAEFSALCRPARSMAARTALSLGVCENFTYTRVPPRKSTPYGMWCQNNMENRPATLNTREKARKYHFLPRKSMLVLRKNSTRLTSYPIYDFVGIERLRD